MSGKILLKNATVYNSDYIKKTTCNILIEDGYIKSIEKLPKRTVPFGNLNQIDLNGKLVLPSFIDSHLHIPGDILYSKYGVNLLECQGVEEYIKKLESIDYSRYKTIRGFGWNELEFKDNPKFLEFFKQKVDEICGKKPVVIYSGDFHSCFCNDSALKICNINKDTEVPYGGEIEKGQDGELSGIIREQATKLINEKLDILGFSREEMKHAILEYQDILLKYGITAVNTFMFIGGDYKTEWEILKELEQEGKLKIKINGSIPVNPNDEPEKILKDFNNMQKYNSKNIRINTAKIYIDGVLDTKTAVLKQPYEGTDYCGEFLWQNDKLEKMVEILDKNGIQIHVHSIGDMASQQIINALEKAINTNNTINDKSNRHVITHLQLIDDEDVLKMASNQIIASVQPYWFPIDKNGDKMDFETIGEERVKEQYKMKTLTKSGVIVTSSSDSPVTKNFSPVLGMYHGVNRYNENEKVSLGEMIKTFTKNGAYQLKRDDEIGEIRVGNKADLVVLEDVLQLNIEDLKTLKIDLCLVDGEVVFDRCEVKKREGFYQDL